jgi:IclR family transcriptional regulator, acetate operon repressor
VRTAAATRAVHVLPNAVSPTHPGAMGAESGPTLISSVQRAMRLLEAVSAHQNGAPAKQLARETGLPLATAYHLLRTLAHDGYVRKLDDGGFVLGDKLQTLHTVGRGQALLSRIRPTLAALRDEFSTAAYLTFYEEGEIRVAEIVDGPRAPRVDLWVGFEDAGHATALGKSVLRELDEESRKEYLSRHALADLTPRTITDTPELLRRLDSSPLAPAVTDLEEYALGTVCVAVPVYSGNTLGSLGVSLRADRISRLEQITARLLPAASRVTRGLSLTI